MVWQGWSSEQARVASRFPTLSEPLACSTPRRTDWDLVKPRGLTRRRAASAAASSRRPLHHHHHHFNYYSTHPTNRPWQTPTVRSTQYDLRLDQPSRGRRRAAADPSSQVRDEGPFGCVASRLASTLSLEAAHCWPPLVARRLDVSIAVSIFRLSSFPPHSSLHLSLPRPPSTATCCIPSPSTHHRLHFTTTPRSRP